MGCYTLFGVWIRKGLVILLVDVIQCQVYDIWVENMTLCDE